MADVDDASRRERAVEARRQAKLRIGRLREKLPSLEAEIVALRAKVMTMRTDEASRREREGDARQQLKQRLAKLREKLPSMEAQIVALRGRIERLQTDGQVLRSRLATAKDEVTVLTERLVNTKRRVTGLSKSLAAAQCRVPVPDILPAMAARRLAVFPPESLKAAAAEREQRFAAASPAYREESAVPPADVRSEIEGLSIFLPAKYAGKIKLPWTLLQEVRAITVGGVMLDIGANVGQTCLPRIVLGDFQAIYAAEPEPDNYARLKATIAANRMNGFVLPDRVAIGSRDGVLRLTRGHFRGHAAAPEGAKSVLEVPLLTIDTWIEQLGIDPDTISYVKTDTNGYELDVIRGAPRLLARGLSVWQIEVAPAFMAPLGADVAMLSEEIKKHFTHFMDFSHSEPGDAIRPVADLPGALDYLKTMETSRGGKEPQTDLICFCA
jgi:FkbM family methyltransferase